MLISSIQFNCVCVYHYVQQGARGAWPPPPPRAQRVIRVQYFKIVRHASFSRCIYINTDISVCSYQRQSPRHGHSLTTKTHENRHITFKMHISFFFFSVGAGFGVVAALFFLLFFVLLMALPLLQFLLHRCSFSPSFYVEFDIAVRSRVDSTACGK